MTCKDFSWIDELQGQKSFSTLNLHAVLKRSQANGPGVRMVIWFQGCTLGCSGCFNPETHPHIPTRIVRTDQLLNFILHTDKGTEGLSISGGEPLQQSEALLTLLMGVKENTNLSIILFSGYTIKEIDRMPLGEKIIANVDVLIAGRYMNTQRLARGLRGSSNQTIHLLSDRYRLEDIEKTPIAEVRIKPDGDIQVSGVAPPKITQCCYPKVSP